MARPVEHPEDEELLRTVAKLIVWEGITDLEDAYRKACRHLTLSELEGSSSALPPNEENAFVVRARKRYPKVREQLEADADAKAPEERLWVHPDGTLNYQPVIMTEQGRRKARGDELRRLVDTALAVIEAAEAGSPDRARMLDPAIRDACAVLRCALEKPLS